MIMNEHNHGVIYMTKIILIHISNPIESLYWNQYAQRTDLSFYMIIHNTTLLPAPLIQMKGLSSLHFPSRQFIL